MNTNRTAFIDATFAGSRMASSEAKTYFPQAAGEFEVKVKVETNGKVSLGLNEIKSPSGFGVEVDLEIRLLDADSKQLYATYNGVFWADFRVNAYVGIEDWTKIPPETLQSSFHLAYRNAVGIARTALRNMGFADVQIPLPDELALDPKVNEPE